MESNKEKEFTFYKCVIDDYTGVKEVPYKVKESELEDSHRALIYANLVKQWNKSDKQSQMRFMHELTFELTQKHSDIVYKAIAPHINGIIDNYMKDKNEQ